MPQRRKVFQRLPVVCRQIAGFRVYYTERPKILAAGGPNGAAGAVKG